MREDSVRAFCPVCRHRQTFKLELVSHRFHCVMSILTLGLWLVSWAAISIGIRLWPWACTQCGWRLSRISLDRERKTASQAGEETE